MLLDEAVVELTHLAGSFGRAGVSDWVKDHASDLSVSFVESIFDSLRRRSSGVALAFAYVLPDDLRPESMGRELASEKERNYGVWVKGLAHMLSGSVLDRAKGALDSGDILCGYQRHYCAGGATPVVFTSYTEFETHVRKTRPGDEFRLASIQEFKKAGALLEPALGAVKEYLAANAMGEVFLVRIKQGAATVEEIGNCRLNKEDVASLFVPKGGLFALPTICERKFFIHLKVPNDKGEVPLGGPY